MNNSSMYVFLLFVRASCHALAWWCMSHRVHVVRTPLCTLKCCWHRVRTVSQCKPRGDTVGISHSTTSLVHTICNPGTANCKYDCASLVKKINCATVHILADYVCRLCCPSLWVNRREEKYRISMWCDQIHPVKRREEKYRISMWCDQVHLVKRSKILHVRLCKFVYFIV